MVNDKVKRAERGSATAAEQVFRTHELIPSIPFGESESRVTINFSAFLGAKDRIQEQLFGDHACGFSPWAASSPASSFKAKFSGSFMFGFAVSFLFLFRYSFFKINFSVPNRVLLC